MFEKSQAEKRRADPRYPFSASAEAVHIQADTRLSGRVSDLGRAADVTSIRSIRFPWAAT